MLASLKHPNIAAIHGLEKDKGARFLVLEFVPGNTLVRPACDGAREPHARLELEGTLAVRVTGPVSAVEQRGAGKRMLATLAAGLMIGGAGVGIWAWQSARPFCKGCLETTFGRSNAFL